MGIASSAITIRDKDMKFIDYDFLYKFILKNYCLEKKLDKVFPYGLQESIIIDYKSLYRFDKDFIPIRMKIIELINKNTSFIFPINYRNFYHEYHFSMLYFDSRVRELYYIDPMFSERKENFDRCDLQIHLLELLIEDIIRDVYIPDVFFVRGSDMYGGWVEKKSMGRFGYMEPDIQTRFISPQLLEGEWLEEKITTYSSSENQALYAFTRNFTGGTCVLWSFSIVIDMIEKGLSSTEWVRWYINKYTDRPYGAILYIKKRIKEYLAECDIRPSTIRRGTSHNYT